MFNYERRRKKQRNLFHKTAKKKKKEKEFSTFENILGKKKHFQFFVKGERKIDEGEF